MLDCDELPPLPLQPTSTSIRPGPMGRGPRWPPCNGERQVLRCLGRGARCMRALVGTGLVAYVQTCVRFPHPPPPSPRFRRCKLCEPREMRERTYVRTYVGTSVQNGLAVLTSYAKCANNARCDTCAKCAKCNQCESRAIRARCANCVCCARHACCRWQVCQPPKRTRTYIRTTIVPIVPIVLFCTRASLPVRILTYVRTYVRAHVGT